MNAVLKSEAKHDGKLNPIDHIHVKISNFSKNPNPGRKFGDEHQAKDPPQLQDDYRLPRKDSVQSVSYE
jgi:hypothetical protein